MKSKNLKKLKISLTNTMNNSSMRGGRRKSRIHLNLFLVIFLILLLTIPIVTSGDKDKGKEKKISCHLKDSYKYTEYELEEHCSSFHSSKDCEVCVLFEFPTLECKNC
ncbi:hypothetical protein J4414_03870 [Candidatus Woesearchaeota archaeon]|nr:hypothetical protein [Candidatus Woesearchaeota archaeon]